MATILSFPVIEQHQEEASTLCTGCSTQLRGDYWEIGVPTEHSTEYFALCDSCNDELMKHGVVL